jgi:putative nucleotidyltransferase with HDIG domain
MTHATQEDVLQQVRSLPPLPAAIGRLLRLVNDPDVNFQEIARTISLDQTLTAQILRIANSAFYGFPQQIRTVQQATVVLGRYAVRNMALSLAMVTLRNRMSDEWPLSPETFWRHSMGVACGARMLARDEAKVDPEEAFVAGLLHDIGKIVLVERDTDGYASVGKEARMSSRPLHELERNAFGIDHAEVGHILCRHWNIPGALGSSVAYHHGGAGPDASDAARSLTAVVSAANVLAKLAGIGDGGDPLIESSWPDASVLSVLAPDRLRRTLEALPDEVALNERIFFQTAAPPGPPPPLEGQAVRVFLGERSSRLLVSFALTGLRCRATASDSGDPDLVVADAALPEAERTRYRQDGVPILDYETWRSNHAPAGFLDVPKLHAWLSHPPIPQSTLT